MEEATITSKGQITIPKDIRDALAIKKGGKMIVIREGEKIVMIKKSKDPLKRLEEIRKELPKFSSAEIEKMIKESKREWSKFD